MIWLDKSLSQASQFGLWLDLRFLGLILFATFLSLSFSAFLAEATRAFGWEEPSHVFTVRVFGDFDQVMAFKVFDVVVFELVE